MKVFSYTQGGIKTTAGKKPQVVASFNDGTQVVLEQDGDQTTLSIDSELYALVPAAAKEIKVDLKKGGFTAEADGVLLPKIKN